jgi:hypothetical protein
MLFDRPCRVAGDPGGALRKLLVPGAAIDRGFGAGG